MYWFWHFEIYKFYPCLAFLLEISTFIAALVFTFVDIHEQRKNPDRFIKSKSDEHRAEKGSSEKPKADRREKTETPTSPIKAPDRTESETPTAKLETEETSRRNVEAETPTRSEDGNQEGSKSTPAEKKPAVSGWLANRKKSQ